MKRLFIVFLWSLLAIFPWNISLASCSNECLAGSVPCDDLPKYLSQSQLDTGAREWSSYKGSVKVVGPKAILVTFRFDQTAINIFKTRSDFALEFDMVDKDHILGKPGGGWTFAHTLKGMTVFKDTSFGDSVWQLSLVAIHPEVLQAEKDYKVYFYTENPIASGQLKLNMSLSVDFEKSSSGGLLCDNRLKHTSNPLNPWNYFTLEIDQFREFQYVPNAESNPGICWVNHDNSGPQYCEDATPVTMCAWKNSTQRVCWLTKDGNNRSCESATIWFIDDTLMKVSRQTDSSACLNYCYGGPSASLSSCASRETSEDYSFGNSSLGGGFSTPATDPTSSGRPDFTVERLRLLGTDGVEKYRFKKTDMLCMEAKLRNIGSKGIGDDDIVRTRFLLSKGYKEDPHGEWRGIESFDTRGGHVEPGESHTEMHCVSLADKDYVLPGHVYNIVAYADRTEVNNNDGGRYAEEHESNNSTTEAPFEVEGTYNFTLNDFAMEKNVLSPGETVKVYANVRNALDQPNEDVSVSLYMSPNGDWSSRWLVDALVAPKDSLVANGGIFWTDRYITFPSNAGQYTLWACVNPEGTIPETNGGDNCKSLWFEVGLPQGCSTTGGCTNSARIRRWLPAAVMILNANNQ